MLVHCWQSIQGLDSGSKKPEKIQLALKLLRDQRPGSRGDLLEGEPAHWLEAAMFMTALILDQLNQFSLCQPLKKQHSVVLPLAATFQHKNRRSAGCKWMWLADTWTNQNIKGFRKAGTDLTYWIFKKCWTDTSVIFCWLNKVGNITNIQNQCCKDHI